MDDLFIIDCGDFFLREFTIEDADAIVEITSQPEVYHFLPDWRTTKEQRTFYLTEYELPSNRAFLSSLPHIEGINPFHGMLKLAIIHKISNKMIGFVCTGIKDELLAPNREIAYAISTDYRNQGYMTRAVKSLLDFLFMETDIELMNALALPENIRSNRVIQKNGFTYLDDIEIENRVYHHYVLHKRDWNY
ncbi:GNAT family N-acetyltransferase [Gorillibacterium massiliense]|uniref:GNAT family N-acetyltransferase n=1 Tax=Gorillibacterium massiliense TaxID=1280390 RepID=UPI00059332E8|nr:GNAT family N-acetyltransferase [Gorillibacterium massiliense]